MNVRAKPMHYSLEDQVHLQDITEYTRLVRFEHSTVQVRPQALLEVLLSTLTTAGQTALIKSITVKCLILQLTDVQNSLKGEMSLLLQLGHVATRQELGLDFLKRIVLS